MYSDASLLFAQPSFLEGMARVVDFGGFLNEYNSSPTGDLADFYALRGDWRAVGKDMETVIARYAREQCVR